MHNILIFGGSFDPPHSGHLNTALAIQKNISFERFIFLPCKTPVLKKATTASCDQRIDMLKRMLAPYPGFEIDLREIQRETPSFMVDTLANFREELGNKLSITLLMGLDAFLQLPQWHAWHKLLDLSHLLVMTRAEIDIQTMPAQLKTLLKHHEILDKTELFNQPHGKIYQYNAGEYAISSSSLRQKMEAGEDVRPYLPESVYQYINKQNIYSPMELP